MTFRTAVGESHPFVAAAARLCGAVGHPAAAAKKTEFFDVFAVVLVAQIDAQVSQTAGGRVVDVG